jgi:hypothetical protein
MVKTRLECVVLGVMCDLVSDRRRETFLLNMKMLREWDERGNEERYGRVIYVACPSTKYGQPQL